MGKKNIGSKISLASLEIVEQQPSNATINCNPTGEPDKRKEEIDVQNQIQLHDICKDVENVCSIFHPCRKTRKASTIPLICVDQFCHCVKVPL